MGQVGFLPSLLLWPGLPSVYLQPCSQTGESTIRDAIRISNGLLLPGIAFQDIQIRSGEKHKKWSYGHIVRWSDGDMVRKSHGEIVSEISPSSASLPADLEQHLGREQQHHHLPGDNDFQIVWFPSCQAIIISPLSSWWLLSSNRLIWKYLMVNDTKWWPTNMLGADRHHIPANEHPHVTPGPAAGKPTIFCLFSPIFPIFSIFSPSFPPFFPQCINNQHSGTLKISFPPAASSG